MRKSNLTAAVLLSAFLAFGSNEARTVYLHDKIIASLTLTVGRTTILSFPAKPSKVVLGSAGMFAIEYIENDLAIAPLSPNAKSNLFVYLEGRRFAFDLTSSAKRSDEIILVRDAIAQDQKSTKRKK